MSIASKIIIVLSVFNVASQIILMLSSIAVSVGVSFGVKSPTAKFVNGFTWFISSISSVIISIFIVFFFLIVFFSFNTSLFLEMITKRLYNTKGDEKVFNCFQQFNETEEMNPFRNYLESYEKLEFLFKAIYSFNDNYLLKTLDMEQEINQNYIQFAPKLSLRYISSDKDKINLPIEKVNFWFDRHSENPFQGLYICRNNLFFEFRYEPQECKYKQTKYEGLSKQTKNRICILIQDLSDEVLF